MRKILLGFLAFLLVGQVSLAQPVTAMQEKPYGWNPFQKNTLKKIWAW